MNGLALCAGVGGLELGLHLALGAEYRTVCFVERDAYAAATLVARMADETLDQAPIWDDVCTFHGSAWRGLVDIVTAGFPCQPHSVAGKRKGLADERWIWPDIWRVIRDVRPGLVFLENVPGLLTSGGFGTVANDLASGGYSFAWDVFSAAEVGASHLRERLYILAHTSSKAIGTYGVTARDWQQLCRGSEWRTLWNRTSTESDCVDCWPPLPEERAKWQQVLEKWPGLKPAIHGVADGAANRVDRLRCLGNGVVPQVAARAFRVLLGRLMR